ncbi:MAG: 3-deoxy-manno-octulosonate cytidylyltransferase [Rickettsiales bacterium]|nr:3-deoxy-manno-octulosonate cytidylyltransferase [Rickettsiales bacterium]
MSAVIAIPSRLGSTRLPNKPLADIEGKPMILRVFEQGLKTGIKDIFVAAAENEIIEVINKNNGLAVLTDASLVSGTDRIYQGLEKLNLLDKFEYVINLQGDLPAISPKVINLCLEAISNKNYNFDIVTPVAKITKEDEKTNPNVVKAVVSWDSKDANTGKALYFTRATAPYGDGDLWHHIGIYAYKISALKKFVSLPASPLEKREKLEQLRALENNLTIGVVQSDEIPLGVDTQEDLEKAREFYRKK